MTSHLLEAAKSVVQQSAGPMTVSQIVAAMGKVPNKKALAEEIRKDLPGETGIHEWPAFRRSPRFGGRSVGSVVEEAVLRALDKEPLTLARAVKAVKVRYVSKERAKKELKVIFPQLTAADRVFHFAASRQSVTYFSRKWMAEQAGADGQKHKPAHNGGDGALSSLVPAAVARLQSISGTYARVDRLRKASEICAVVDKTILRLAAAGELVLGRYDGVRPVPDDDKWMYVEDERGELFIGIALPRGSEANE